MKLSFIIFLLSLTSLYGQQKSDSGIRHSIVISGPRALEFNENDDIVWEFEGNTRDITKLENGNYLISLRDKIIEVTADKNIVWTYQSTMNEELMSAQRLPNGMTLVTELGLNPRLVEVNALGEIEHEIPIQPETDNVHMQSRMARKLSNGNYLVPHRLMPFVKEYDKEGHLVKSLRVDIPQLGGPEAGNGTFVAIRLDNGTTVITCASGNRLVILDKEGNLEWQLTTEEIGGQLQDVCGLQVLKNGNFLVSCYGNQTHEGLKMMEITRDKKIVWTYQNPDVRYVHTLQVLTTNGMPE